MMNKKRRKEAIEVEIRGRGRGGKRRGLVEGKKDE